MLFSQDVIKNPDFFSSLPSALNAGFWNSPGGYKKNGELVWIKQFFPKESSLEKCAFWSPKGLMPDSFHLVEILVSSLGLCNTGGQGRWAQQPLLPSNQWRQKQFWFCSVTFIKSDTLLSAADLAWREFKGEVSWLEWDRFVLVLDESQIISHRGIQPFPRWLMWVCKPRAGLGLVPGDTAGAGEGRGVCEAQQVPLAHPWLDDGQDKGSRSLLFWCYLCRARELWDGERKVAGERSKTEPLQRPNTLKVQSNCGSWPVMQLQKPLLHNSVLLGYIS